MVHETVILRITTNHQSAMIEERKKLNELHEKEITERTDEFEKIQNTLEQSIAQLTINSKKDNVFLILNI